jgi:Amt family ammonium transporter
VGALGGFFTHFSVKIKNLLGFDDTLDAWGFHGFGGVLGNILAGIFAQKWVAELDHVIIPGGWLDGNWIQVGYQLAATAAIAAWAFTVTFLILLTMSFIPGCSLRVSNKTEEMGQDTEDMGEWIFDEFEQGTTTALKVAQEGKITTEQYISLRAVVAPDAKN